MTKEIVRTEEEINEVLDQCSELINDGESRYDGMSYEEGIQAMYDWLVGNTEDYPID